MALPAYFVQFRIAHATKFQVPDAQLPDKSSLVARDAYNGLILWKRPVPDWGTRSFKSDRLNWGARDLMFSSPAMLPRRLVASGDRLYVTLGFSAPLSELDAVTGETLRTFAGTSDTQEILLSDRTLFLHIRDAEKISSVVALDLADGKVKWRHKAGLISPVTLAVARNRAAYFNGKELVVLNTADGSELWRAAGSFGPRARERHCTRQLCCCSSRQHRDLCEQAGEGIFRRRRQTALGEGWAVQHIQRETGCFYRRWFALAGIKYRSRAGCDYR